MIIKRLDQNMLIERMRTNSYDVTWFNITKNCTLVGSKLVPGTMWQWKHISIAIIWLDREEYLGLTGGK